MKILKVLLTISIICIASIGFAEDKKYKPAPEPQYTKEKGYGWSPKVPYGTAKDPWELIKSWRTEKGFSIFIDKDKDGVCDTVAEFEYNGEFAKDGAPYVIQKNDSNCFIRDIEIKRFIKDNK